VDGQRTSNNCHGIRPDIPLKCNTAQLDKVELWHQWLGHFNFKDLFKTSKNELILVLPKLGKLTKAICGPYQLEKQIKSLHRKTSSINTSSLLELMHMDLMSRTRSLSIGGKRFIMVMVDDFSRYTWVTMLREKSKACDQAKAFFKKNQNEKGCLIKRIGSDHEREFENNKIIHNNIFYLILTCFRILNIRTEKIDGF
jgi:hypothetical protein